MQAVENHTKLEGETINIVDDKPIQFKDLLEELAKMIGAKRPRKVPLVLAKLFLGAYGVNFMTSSVQVSNLKTKSVLGWEPIYPTFKEGFTQVMLELGY